MSKTHPGQFRVPYGIVLLLAMLLILALFSAGCISQPPQPQSLEEKYADQMTAAENLTKIMEEHLLNGSLSLRGAADTIAEDPTNETLVDQVFTDIYTEFNSVTAFIVVDAKKRIIDICPAGNPGLTPYLGVTISDPDFNYSAQSPAVSVVDTWSRDNSVSTAILPMIAKDGSYQGTLLIVLDSALIYEKLVHTFQQTTGYNAWILEPDGGILYTPDRAQTEESVLKMTAPNQTELDQLTQKILSTKSGVETYATYSYGKLKIINRVAAWDSVLSPANISLSSPIIVVTSDIDSTQRVDYPTRTTNLKLEEFVRSAYLFARENGPEAALAEFNKADGNFTTKEYYIAAFDINNTLLANPYRPGVIGTDRTPYEDSNGVATVQMFTARAKQGGGYVTHVYENPADNMEVQLKISYVLPINDTWYVTAGEYYPEIQATIPPGTRMEMMQYAREIISFILKEGKETAVVSLNNGSHYRDDIELSIYDYNGNSIVHDPEPWSSENLLGITDIYGASIGRGTIAMAKDGGGFKYINLPSKRDATTRLSLKYVQPIDDEWFILLTVPMELKKTA